MNILRLRLALLSFVAVGALAGAAAAQDAPPADPAGVIDPDAAADPVETDPLDGDPEADTPVEAEVVAIPAVWAPVPTDADGRSAYGLYLAGRLAQSRGLGETGADLYARVEVLTPEQPSVRLQTFTAALLAGDLDLAARLRPSGEGVPPVISEAGRLVSVVQAFVHDDPAAGLAELRSAPIQQPHARAGLYVQPWIAAAAGDWDLALRLPPAAANDPTSLFVRHSRALLLEHRRRYDEADAAFAGLTANPLGAQLFRRSHAEYLERRGRRDEALAVYDAAIAGGSTDPTVAQGRARLMARGRAPAAPTLRAGAADVLTIAAIQASTEGGAEVAAVYLRLALNLAPTDLTRFRLGQALAAAGREADARDALARVAPSDPALHAQARMEMGRSFQREEQAGAALEEFNRAAGSAPDAVEIAYVRASQLIQLDRYDEALEILNGPLLNIADQPFEFHFVRGVAYESLGRVDEAEAELWAALQARPDDPTVLNYLGYLWVDSGKRVHQGAEMIARAHEAEPENGNIQDSLGWAQYRQGRYDLAVDTLEAAVAKEPANAEINDHLGDAYWQVGRRREAGFQWERVLTLDPDADQQAEVERKLAEGLAPQVPVSGTGA